MANKTNTYMENLHNTMEKCNRYSYEYGDGKAQDNRKKKTYKRYVPRGKLYLRMINAENRAAFDDIDRKMRSLASDLGVEI